MTEAKEIRRIGTLLGVGAGPSDEDVFDPAYLGRVRRALEDHRRRLTEQVTVVRFEDHGQDFLAWAISDNGFVEDCWPFQASAWAETYVFSDIKVGARLGIIPPHVGKERVLNYPIERMATGVNLAPGWWKAVLNEEEEADGPTGTENP